MKIAVCITTHNRPEVFDKTYSEITRYLPPNAKRFIVDDASDEPMVETGHRGHRFDENVGIAKAKNKCLELAYEWGADHIFLFDDDTYPIKQDWWKPYVESKEPHLMYNFKLKNKPTTDMQEIYRGENIVAYTHTRGCMIYLTREVLEAVGGFDTRYQNGFEHPDFTRRIYNAGLTTYRSMDVSSSSRLFYCLDQDSSVESSIASNSRRDLNNYRLFQQTKLSKEYKEFK